MSQCDRGSRNRCSGAAVGAGDDQVLRANLASGVVGGTVHVPASHTARRPASLLTVKPLQIRLGPSSRHATPRTTT